MFPPTRYLAWANEFFGKIGFDSASSGIPRASFEEVGLAAPTLDDPTGYQRLRESIAFYNDVPVADVAPAMGTSHAIFLAYAAMLGPDDEIILENPVYEPLVRNATGLGARIRFFERSAATGYAVDPVKVAARVTPRTRAIVVTNLHNPTGVRIDDETLRELARIAEARGAYLLVDEVYAPFDDLPDDGVFRTSARKLGANVVTIGSLTKCYGLGMHRVGWVLGPPEVQVGIRDASLATFGHMPLSHACIGACLLSNIGRFSKRAKPLFAGKRELAERWVRSFPNATWSAPRSGLFGFVTLEGRDDLRPDIERLARENDVLVGPGTFFGIPNGFRLSWANLPTPRFEEGLDRLTPLIRGIL